jgi:Cdc6-like AAA superfamily ATPase
MATHWISLLPRSYPGQLGEDTAVKSIYINCWQYDSRSSLLTELLIELGYPVPRKGRPVDELLSRIQEFVDKSRGVALALDEFDKLGDQTEVVYDLEMVSEDSDQHLGMVLVSNHGPEQVSLGSRSKSRLSCQTVQFEPYSAADLMKILEHRVEKAFRPGSVPDQTLRHIAEEVADRGGDCRQALSRLLSLGRVADRRNMTKITLEMAENE